MLEEALKLYGKQGWGFGCLPNKKIIFYLQKTEKERILVEDQKTTLAKQMECLSLTFRGCQSPDLTCEFFD